VLAERGDVSTVAGERLSDSEVQRRVVTLAKQTPERTWLAEVASVALVQACQDARRAYRNWFDSQPGRRKGRRVVKIGRWKPTSQTCSACGHRNGPKPPSIRAWACPACGVVHDRDINAARNILVAAGLVETPNAWGAGIRPSVMTAVGDEAGTRRGAA
jgi:putative transposase